MFEQMMLLLCVNYVQGARAFYKAGDFRTRVDGSWSEMAVPLRETASWYSDISSLQPVNTNSFLSTYVSANT
jgi:hypothetical protein